MKGILAYATLAVLILVSFAYGGEVKNSFNMKLVAHIDAIATVPCEQLEDMRTWDFDKMKPTSEFQVLCKQLWDSPQFPEADGTDFAMFKTKKSTYVDSDGLSHENYDFTMSKEVLAASKDPEFKMKAERVLEYSLMSLALSHSEFEALEKRARAGCKIKLMGIPATGVVMDSLSKDEFGYYVAKSYQFKEYANLWGPRTSTATNEPLVPLYIKIYGEPAFKAFVKAKVPYFEKAKLGFEGYLNSEFEEFLKDKVRSDAWNAAHKN